MLLTGGDTVNWGEPARESIETTIVGGQEYEKLDADESSDSKKGATEATLKAYGENEQFRTYLPQLSVTRWDGTLHNGLPSYASFRIECRNGELCVILDGDHNEAVLENGEVRDPDELPGYPISLQSSANRSQVNLNFPKQIAHALSLKQEEQLDETGEKTIEVTVIRWSVDQLNQRRLLGRLTREARDG
jgi:hypothetical protein